MRILIINSEYPPIGGGAGNASANIARELCSRGQEVRVLTARFGNQPGEEVMDGVRVRRARSLRRRLDRSTALEQLLFIFGGSLVALRLAHAWRPDVVLAFFGTPSGVIAWLLKLFFGLPYVISLRGGDVPGFRPYDFAIYHRLLGPLLHIVWRSAGRVIANSTGLRVLAQRFDPRVPIQVIPNGVDLRYFSLCERTWDPPHMLFVGRLVYQKGLDVLFNALKALRFLPWELSLVGDGPQLQNLQAQAAALQIDSRVHFHSWLQGKALLEQYRKANLFVFPSRHEGMPNAVLEAMASGLPVVASAIAGNEELVLPEQTGCLVPVEDAQALEETLRRLLTDQAARQHMGAAARKRVEELFDWSWVTEQYLRHLEEVVKKLECVESVA